MNARLSSWIKKNCKLSEYQAGFQKKNKCCLDHIFVLNSLIQTQLLKNKKLYACFVDLSQAFDTPEHNLLWNVLLSIGISPKFVRLFSYIYRLARAQVSTSDGLTDPIEIMKGVLQGEVASPSIFNLFIEGIVEDLRKSNIHGLRLQAAIVHILLYADDMTIVAATRETLQLKIDVAARFLRKRGLVINLGKSKIVVFKRSGRISKFDNFTWNEESIEVVKFYTYLGVTFQSSGIFDLAASQFIKKGIMAQGAVLSALKKIKKFNLSSSSKLFDSIVKSTALYGAGIWGILNAEKLERVQ